jgi:hypothetical protein
MIKITKIVSSSSGANSVAAGSKSVVVGASAGNVTHVFDLNAPAQEVWDLIGPFDSLPRWHSLVAECTLEKESGSKESSGAIVRRIRLHDGTIILNRLVEHSDAGRFYTYEFMEGPLKVDWYRSTLRVLDNGKARCRIEWLSQFETRSASLEEVKHRIESLIGPGAENLKRLFNR